MSDISYEILDLMKEYGESRQGLDEAWRREGKTCWNGWIFPERTRYLRWGPATEP